MKKVALVTEYGNTNIGNKLQNYAVKQICNNHSFIAETFQYKTSYAKIGMLKKLCALMGVPKKKALRYRLTMKRQRKFEQFSNQYLTPIRSVEMGKIDDEIVRSYDFFLAGSDQVWHNADEERLCYFFLRFAPKEKRVCISPSFGASQIPTEKWDIFRTGLQGFLYLSCREEEGCEIIRQISGKEAALLCDPTMALTADEWRQISVKHEAIHENEFFVLVYMLGHITDSESARISDFAAQKGMRVIKIFDAANPRFYSTTPCEFIDLIDKAAFVFTNSFHGTVFSIIFHKPFVVFNRLDNKGIPIMQTRLNNLLNVYKLQDHFYRGSIPEYPVEWERVDSAIAKEKDKIDRWIETTMGQ